MLPAELGNSVHDTGCNLTRCPAESPSRAPSRRAVAGGSRAPPWSPRLSGCGTAPSDGSAARRRPDRAGGRRRQRSRGDRRRTAHGRVVAGARNRAGRRPPAARASPVVPAPRAPRRAQPARRAPRTARSRAAWRRRGRGCCAAEEKLQGQLVRAALEAESGALAQVFAAMAAAVAQERAVCIMSDPRPTDALQTALAAEHAAVFVYGALGGQTSQSTNPHAVRRGHRRLCHAPRATGRPDRADRGRRPRAGGGRAGLRPARGPLDGRSPSADRALELERSCAATYAYVVGSTRDAQRKWAIEALLDAAVRELAFGGKPVRLPGL